MADTWPAEVSKRDVSPALCQDKLHDQDDKATGTGGSHENPLDPQGTYLAGYASTSSLPPQCLSWLLAGAWLVTVKFSCFPFWYHKEVIQTFL